MTQHYHQEHHNPSIIILRDEEGDYLVSFNGGITSAYLTVDGRPEGSLEPTVTATGFSEYEVWRSGPDA